MLIYWTLKSRIIVLYWIFLHHYIFSFCYILVLEISECNLHLIVLNSWICSQSIFLFSAIWSLGGPLDEASRAKFDLLLRELIAGDPSKKSVEEYALCKVLPPPHDYQLPIPDEDTVFHYKFVKEVSLSWCDFVQVKLSLVALSRSALWPCSNPSGFTWAVVSEVKLLGSKMWFDVSVDFVKGSIWVWELHAAQSFTTKLGVCPYVVL